MAHEAVPLDDRARRFLFRRRIGEGAFGVVWEAYDTERGARVALKALTRTEPSSLFLFKREFRALADIAHPNLVALYELLSYGEKWFFTMEFVEGVDFIEHVRGMSDQPRRSRGTETMTILHSGALTTDEIELKLAEADASGVSLLPAKQERPTMDAGILLHAGPWYDQPTEEFSTLEGGPTSIAVRVAEPTAGTFLPERARPALAQLAEGLSTLHEAGKLHRDIKPSNVLVAGNKRVVILDFGLITELWPTGVQRDMNAIVGTPAYMSPEQSLGKALTPASDWYAVGVMLYVALTGKLPFDGTPLQVLIAKQRLDPAPPSTVVPNVPADLDELCMDLLRRRPEERPTGAEVLRRLGADASSSAGRSHDHRSAFVGRGPQLQALKEGFDATHKGKPSAAIVHGGSRMGKSALAAAFVRQLKREEPDALVLAGRCFSRESVPYKAIDSLIDELCSYLQTLPTARSAVLLPRSTDALVRIFPVLRQVEGAAPTTLRPPAVTSEVELRRRAFAALRELLGRIAERKHVVLVLDDMQWSDADSDALLGEILRGPDAPPLFVLATYRSDDIEATPLVRALRAEDVETRVLRVDPLSQEEAYELALRYVAGHEVRAAAIARESGGSPFFVEMLADHVTMVHGDEDRAPDSVVRVDLGDVFREKMRRLPEVARKLLETVAVAGHPIPVIPAWKAADITLPEQSMLSLLIVRHLLRSQTDFGAAHEEIELYHDRLRDTVLAGLSPAAIQVRRERIARALEAAGGTDPEVLASHFEAAGRLLEAGRYALLAANQSAAKLAFDRAARLYRWALGLAPSSDDGEILGRLGNALANAGRGAEAADAYLAAARGASDARALELRRKAAEQLLISGHAERGMEVIRLVMGSLGMKLPQSREAAILSFLAGRARLKLRGFDFRERDEADIPEEELLRIDAAWAVSVGLALVDPIRSTDAQCKHLLLALDAGEPYRIARALAVEVTYVAMSGPKAAARTAEIVERSLELAQRIHHPHALGLATTMSGAGRYLAGRWKDSIEALDRGARILREQCSGVTWELDTADIFVFSALQWLGRWKELTVRFEDFIRSAQARGDLYAETHAMLETAWYVEIARDQPHVAREHIRRAFAHKKGDSYDVHDFLFFLASTSVDLYCGHAESARRRVDETWPRARAALMLEIYVSRMETMSLRIRSRIACAAEPYVGKRERDAFLRDAEKDIAKVEEDPHVWPRANAALFRAGVATVRGEKDVARMMVERAERAYATADMEVHTAVARIRLGQLLGGTRGAELRAEGESRLAAQNIKAPAKVARMLAPGRWES
jgi:serine/threonine protein kinase/tetratricopeptide (TPR) repeat protein